MMMTTMMVPTQTTRRARVSVAQNRRSTRHKSRTSSTAPLRAIAPPEREPVRTSDVELFEDAKRLQTQATTVGVDTTCIRSLDWDRDRFDIEFGLEKGTTYNSYIVRGEPGTVALIDSSHEKFKELYLKTLTRDRKSVV